MTELTRELLEHCAAAEGCDLKQMMFEYLTNEQFKRRIDLIERAYSGPVVTARN